MGNVRFKIGDQIITADVLSQSDSKSRHTGKGLIQLEVQFKAHAAQRKSIQDALSGTGTLLSQDASKDVAVLLYEKEYSYTDAHPMQNHIWTLTQKEKLMLDSLQLADISLQPYRFKESFDGDALIITARVEVDLATEEAFEGTAQVFPRH